ncbi:nSTAND1 domain-containing NTPase [Jatrophihabitans endophyticus]|uniref:nSTAND1 domain-containing NTPase n=1 Tax=Jatrophihabitans endophyticus TaxID=1206085 RepID=UPI0013563145|nr:helix-turn-helix domain-containing protein [Jatrophihabitans endophyticus]
MLTRADLAAGLRTVRARADLSIRELARRVGVPHATLGGWFSGRNLPTPGQLTTLAAMLRECGLGQAEVAAWLDAARRVRATPARVTRPGSPYPGLASFDVADADVFFGRTSETEAVLARLVAGHEQPAGSLLAVIGPSGSGKSSLLRAGVAAAVLARDGAGSCVVTTPGDDPHRALDEALAELGSAGVLVLDQFEELFTATDDAATRAAFLDRLTTPPAGVRVVLGMRADFYARAAAEPALVTTLQHGQILLGPLGADALRDAVEGPARAVGVTVEPGLADLVLADLAPRDSPTAAHDAGSLPLLSHALLTAWELGTGRLLSVADYRTAGGLDGAVQRTAEQAYDSLDAAGRDAARDLFLRLVRIEDDVAVTRRRVAGAELAALLDADSALRGVLAEFVRRRLLTSGDGTVEISHEALLTAWPRLRDWIDTDRDGLRLSRTVTQAANEWDATDRDDALLLRGTRLAAAAELAASPTLRTRLNPLERDYVAAGTAARDAARHRARRRTRRLRRLFAAVAALALVAAGLAAYSLDARSHAATAEGRARDARDEAVSRQIAGRARELSAADPALAAQLALVAYREAPTDDARGALVDQSSRPAITRVLGSQGPTPLALSADGRLLAVGHADTGTVHLYRRTAAVPVALGVVPAADAARHQVFALAFSADGHTLAVGGEAHQVVRLWDVRDPGRPQPTGVVATGFTDDVQDVAFSPAGTLLAVAGTGPHPVRVWDVRDPSTPRALAVPAGAPAAGVTAMRVRFAPDGRRLAVAAKDGAVRTWRVAGTAVTGGRRAAPLGDALLAAAWSHDGRDLFVGDVGGKVVALDAATMRPRHAAVTVTTGNVNALAAAPGGAGFVAATSEGAVSQWSTVSWTALSSLGHPGPVTGVAYTPDGTTLLTTAADGTLRTYPASAGLPTDDSVYNLAASRDGRRLAVATSGTAGGLRLWDLRDPDRPRRMSPLVTMPAGSAPITGTVALRRDGAVVAAGNPEGRVALFDVHEPAHPAVLGHVLQALRSGSLVESLTWSPDGRLLAVGGDDDSVRLLDVRDPARPRQVATVMTGGLVLNTAISPDGRYLAAASADAHGYVWDISTPARPRLRARLGGFASYAYSVAFAPASDRVAVGSADHTTRVWRLGGATVVPVGPRLIGSTGYNFALAFSPDGTQLAVGSSDDAVRLYDVAGTPIRVPVETLESLGGNVFALAWTSDGTHLLGAGRAASVAVWDVDVAAYGARLCTRVGDPITRDEWALYAPGVPYDPPCR